MSAAKSAVLPSAPGQRMPRSVGPHRVLGGVHDARGRDAREPRIASSAAFTMLESWSSTSAGIGKFWSSRDTTHRMRHAGSGQPAASVPIRSIGVSG